MGLHSRHCWTWFYGACGMLLPAKRATYESDISISFSARMIMHKKCYYWRRRRPLKSAAAAATPTRHTYNNILEYLELREILEPTQTTHIIMLANVSFGRMMAQGYDNDVGGNVAATTFYGFEKEKNGRDFHKYETNYSRPRPATKPIELK